MTVTSDPLAPVSGQFALTGSTFDPVCTDVPSSARPFGLRQSVRATGGRALPSWRYDDVLQMAVTTADGLPLLGKDPSADTTSRTDGEDPPSSEDWDND